MAQHFEARLRSQVVAMRMPIMILDPQIRVFKILIEVDD